MYGAGIAAVGLFLEQLEEQERDQQAKRRLRISNKFFRDLSDPFDLPNESFRQHYRLTKPIARDLIDLLRPYLMQNQKTKIPIVFQVLCTLRLLAEGSFQKGAGSDWKHVMSQASVSRCIDTVLDAIYNIRHDFIKFPSNRIERETVAQGFQPYNRIPNILGAIDCYLVAIIRPSENEEAFYNHKIGPSLIVQAIVDSNYNFLSITTCPGSNNDRFVWNQSLVKPYFTSLRNDPLILQNEGKYYFLADRGYTLSPLLLTPFRDPPPHSPQETYTNELTRTRCRVEQAFGILGNVFMAVNKARKLYYKPEKASKIVVSCAVLYNYRRAHGMLDDPIPDIEEEEINNILEQDTDYAAGLVERDNIINNFY